WWEFRAGNRQLLIKCIDATHYEAQSGADLVYMRRNPDAFVIVQYKLLRPGRNGGLVYAIDDRLPSQLHRMIAISRGHKAAPTDKPSQWRLGTGSAFVKFVDPTGSRNDEL